ncbi:MAG: hypothetical protein ACJ790_11740, partial [Myxococcaceae bacterium]
MSLAVIASVALLSACHDFQGELDRCLDGGHCAAPAVDAATPVDSGTPPGADGSTPDAGAPPCDAGLDLCVDRADSSPYFLRAVWTPATGNRYWVAAAGGYIARCVNDACEDKSTSFPGDWNRIEGGSNFDDVVLGGTESEVRGFFKDGGTFELASSGLNSIYGTFMSPDGLNSWASGDGAGMVSFRGIAPIEEKTVEDSNEVVHDLFGEGRPTIAVGRSA